MKTKRNVIIFIIVTLASGWIGVLLDKVLTEQPEGNSLGMGLWLILPLVTSVILRLTSRDGKDTGIKLNLRKNVKWYLTSILIYPLITAITYGLAVIFKAVDTSDFKIHSFFTLMAASLVPGFIKNIFEEFAWRGYLTPKLIQMKVNDWLIYLISGLTWALWHGAYYIVFLPDHYFETLSRFGTLTIGTVLMVCWTIMFVEIYRLTKSVWPCVLMHTVEDAVPTLLTTSGLIVLTKSGELWWNPITGIMATVLVLGIGLSLRYIRIKREEA